MAEYLLSDSMSTTSNSSEDEGIDSPPPLHSPPSSSCLDKILCRVPIARRNVYMPSSPGRLMVGSLTISAEVPHTAIPKQQDASTFKNRRRRGIGVLLYNQLHKQYKAMLEDAHASFSPQKVYMPTCMGLTSGQALFNIKEVPLVMAKEAPLVMAKKPVVVGNVPPPKPFSNSGRKVLVDLPGVTRPLPQRVAKQVLQGIYNEQEELDEEEESGNDVVLITDDVERVTRHKGKWCRDCKIQRWVLIEYCRSKISILIIANVYIVRPFGDLPKFLWGVNFWRKSCSAMPVVYVSRSMGSCAAPVR